MVMVFKANFRFDWTIRQGKNTIRGTRCMTFGPDNNHTRDGVGIDKVQTCCGRVQSCETGDRTAYSAAGFRSFDESIRVLWRYSFSRGCR